MTYTEARFLDGPWDGQVVAIRDEDVDRPFKVYISPTMVHVAIYDGGHVAIYQPERGVDGRLVFVHAATHPQHWGADA